MSNDNIRTGIRSLANRIGHYAIALGLLIGMPGAQVAAAAPSMLSEGQSVGAHAVEAGGHGRGAVPLHEQYRADGRGYAVELVALVAPNGQPVADQKPAERSDGGNGVGVRPKECIDGRESICIQLYAFLVTIMCGVLGGFVVTRLWDVFSCSDCAGWIGEKVGLFPLLRWIDDWRDGRR